MVRKIELRVSLQQLVASQKGPGAGRAAAGRAERALWPRASFHPADDCDSGRARLDCWRGWGAWWGRQRQEGGAKGMKRERRGRSEGGR